MDYALVLVVSLVAAGVTLFSGFGLGTVLMPAFALVFPVPVAVAATAVVHLANNLFKLGLVGRAARWQVVWRFGLPAAGAAVVGALILGQLSAAQPWWTYELGGRTCEVTLVKLVVGGLIVLFALGELFSSTGRLSFSEKYLPLGGALSGFFGGLSGNQGALRSAFLLRCGLDRDAFIATGVVLAVVVDVMRLPVYAAGFSRQAWPEGLVGLVAAATLAAFLGSFVGSRLLKKVTLKTVHTIVGILLALLGLGLAAGMI
jgi:uncharacterized membrane protein YfcA